MLPTFRYRSTPSGAPRQLRPRRAQRRASLAAAVALIASTLGITATADAQYVRVSVAHNGGLPDSGSNYSRVSANGRFVVFTSVATNLVLGDTNALTDVFVRDLVTNTTERVNVTSAGLESNGLVAGALAISDDGNLLFFATTGALAPEDTLACDPDVTPLNCVDIYVRDRAAGTTTLLTRGLNDQPANQASDDVAISGDGRYVAFNSRASNLVEHDTNDTPDIFLLDRTTQTITRVSTGPNGEQAAAGASAAAISADGSTVAFTSTSALTAEAASCTTLCVNLFVKTVATGALRSFPFQSRFPDDTSQVLVRASLDGAGRTAAVRTAGGFKYTPHSGVTRSSLHRVDLVTGESVEVSHQDVSTPPLEPIDYSAAISRDGRYLAYSDGHKVLALYDHAYRTPLTVPESGFGEWPGFSADGRYIVFHTLASLEGDDTLQEPDVYRYDRDADNDGLPSLWETRYGLDPNDPADAALDPDHDGLTNLQELAAAGHPNAEHRRYFAEGVAQGFFSTSFAFLNPGATSAEVVLRLFADDGATRSIPVTVGARSRATLHSVTQFPAGTAFATVVESSLPVVVDRLMEWNRTPIGEVGGASLETSIAAPAPSWFFAEGATGNGFSLYYLLGNLSDTDASVTVDYLRQAPLPPLSETFTLKAHSRLSLDVASRFPELLVGPVSARVTSTVPIVAERAMYYGQPAGTLEGGHASAGITDAAPRWFLAEGATGFFDEYVLVANPSNADTDVTFTFLPQDGASFSVTRTVAANSRYTLDVKEFPQLAHTSLSVIAESTNNTPIVAERAMWWPSGVWYEGSLSAGVTAPGTKWAIAEGRLLMRGYSTYILVANTDATRDGQVKVTLLFDLSDAIETTLDVPRMSRRTLDLASVVPADIGHRFVGAIVESVDDLPVIVERSLYFSTADRVFNAGGTSVATNISPIPPQ